jgi:ubiquitin-conjugating enzyme E2 O
MRPLEKGEVGVSFFPSGVRDILPESEFTLVDRMFQPGDLCKRSIDDVRSGVITSVDVNGRLEHAISGEPVTDWKSMNDIETPADVDIGDYVAYDNWIGQVRPSLATNPCICLTFHQVVEVRSLPLAIRYYHSDLYKLFDEAVVDVSNGRLVRLPELSSRLTVGEKGSVSDFMANPEVIVTSCLGHYPTTRERWQLVRTLLKTTPQWEYRYSRGREAQRSGHLMAGHQSVGKVSLPFRFRVVSQVGAAAS